MASGLCLRVLLLSLINIGQLTFGDVYRFGTKNLRPYSEEAAPSPRSYNPPLLRYDDFVQPRAFGAGSKFPEGFKPYEPTKGGQVDSYSQRGSVPSYRPASNPVKESQSGFYQKEPAMWHPEAKGGRTGSNIVSSGAILMHAPETSPQQQLSSPNSGVLQSKTDKWDSASLEMQSKGTHSAAQPPRRHPVSGPGVVQGKGTWDSVFASSGQSPGMYPANQLPKYHPAFSGPQGLKSKEGMPDNIFASGGQSPGMYPASKPPRMPVAPEPPRQQSKAVWKTVPASNVQSLGMYSKASPPYESPARQLQNNPGMWDSRYAPDTKSQEKNFGGRLPLTHPAFSTPAVVQTKEGMWGSAPRGSRPAAFGNYPRGQQLRGVVDQLSPATDAFQGRAGVLDGVGSSAAAKQTRRLSRPVLGSSFGYEDSQPASAQRNY